MLAKVDKFIFPAEFVVVDINQDKDMSLILGRPFIATGQTLIDVKEGKITLTVQDDEVMFNVHKAMTCLAESNTCYLIKNNSFIQNYPMKKHLNSSFEHSKHEGNAKVKMRKKAKKHVYHFEQHPTHRSYKKCGRGQIKGLRLYTSSLNKKCSASLNKTARVAHVKRAFLYLFIVFSFYLFFLIFVW